jgi:hypothetical protein
MSATLIRELSDGLCLDHRKHSSLWVPFVSVGSWKAAMKTVLSLKTKSRKFSMLWLFEEQPLKISAGKATHAPLCCRKCYSFCTYYKEALEDHVASQCEQGIVVKYIDGELENLPATESDQMQIIMGADFETRDDHPKLSILNQVHERLHQAREHLKVMESTPMDESSPSAPEVEDLGDVGLEEAEFDGGFIVEDGDRLPEAHQQQKW